MEKMTDQNSIVQSEQISQIDQINQEHRDEFCENRSMNIEFFIEFCRWFTTISVASLIIIYGALNKSDDEFPLVASTALLYGFIFFVGFVPIVTICSALYPMYILFWGTKWLYGLASWPLMDTIAHNLNLSAALW